MPEAMAVFALRQSQQLGSSAANLLSTAPNLVLSPLNYTIVNLRPFDIQVYVTHAHRYPLPQPTSSCRAEAVDFVGLIYLLILSVSSLVVTKMTRHQLTLFLVYSRCK